MKRRNVEAVYPMVYETFEEVAAVLPRFIGRAHNRKRLYWALR